MTIVAVLLLFFVFGHSFWSKETMVEINQCKQNLLAISYRYYRNRAKKVIEMGKKRRLWKEKAWQNKNLQRRRRQWPLIWNSYVGNSNKSARDRKLTNVRRPCRTSMKTLCLEKYNGKQMDSVWVFIFFFACSLRCRGEGKYYTLPPMW